MNETIVDILLFFMVFNVGILFAYILQYLTKKT